MRYGKNILNIIEDEMSTMPDIDSILATELFIKGQSSIFLAGAGRSGLIASMFGMRLMHLGFKVYIVGDVTTPAITSNDTLIIISGSGETSSMVNIAEKAFRTQCKIILITANIQTTLTRLSHITYLIGPMHESRTVGNILPLTSRFELTALTVLEATVLELMRLMTASDKDMSKNHANLE